MQPIHVIQLRFVVVFQFNKNQLQHLFLYLAENKTKTSFRNRLLSIMCIIYYCLAVITIV